MQENMKVFRYKISSVAIPFEVTFSNDEQLEMLEEWAEDHTFMVWTEISDECKYDDTESFNEWKSNRLED